MAKKAAKPASANVQSQSRDSVGINPKKDGTRAKGAAAVGFMRNQGTKSFRKRRGGGE
jgi:hypothetical protein